MFTDSNDVRLLGWLNVGMTHYRDLVDTCTCVETIFTREMWIEQSVKIQVDFLLLENNAYE